MSATGGQLVAEVRELLAEHADPVRAEGQRRYMKSAMPFRGLTAPQLKQVLREPLSMHQLATVDDWRDTVRTLWDEATHREERYAAIALARHRYYRDWASAVPALRLYEHLVRTGAWWDLVDETASHLVGGVLQAHPEVKSTLLIWAHDDNLWVRRTAILSQLRFNDRTDLAFLTETIELSIDDRDFFARKAIGWALREVAKWNPEWVRSFVHDHQGLSGLSRREALKNLPV